MLCVCRDWCRYKSFIRAGTMGELQHGGTQMPVTVRIGELIDTPQSTDRGELEAVTQCCVEAIHEMHDLGR